MKKSNKNSQKNSQAITTVVPIIVLTDRFCQECIFHTNKPSYCNRLMEYVARKEKACSLFE
jgi:hypothetical protein